MMFLVLQIGVTTTGFDSEATEPKQYLSNTRQRLLLKVLEHSIPCHALASLLKP